MSDYTREDSFTRIKAGPLSIGRRTLVCGVGKNDAWYKVSIRRGGKVEWCPFYLRWRGMLSRCHGNTGGLPSYKGCSVAEEWLTFSNFLEWMERQPWQGRELDKDLICFGNREYSPDTCIFVPHKINSMIHEKAKSEYPNGVCFHKGNGRIRAYSRSLDGKCKHLGYFSCVHMASAAALEARADCVHEAASAYRDDPRLYKALLSYADNAICRAAIEKGRAMRGEQ